MVDLVEEGLERLWMVKVGRALTAIVVEEMEERVIEWVEES